jgi:hypothetical protein
MRHLPGIPEGPRKPDSKRKHYSATPGDPSCAAKVVENTRRVQNWWLLPAAANTTNDKNQNAIMCWHVQHIPYLMETMDD